jgi:hypothetical protein
MAASGERDGVSLPMEFTIPPSIAISFLTGL